MLLVFTLMIIFVACFALRFSMKHHYKKVMVQKFGYPEKHILTLRVAGYALLFIGFVLSAIAVNSIVLGLLVFFGMVSPCIVVLTLAMTYSWEAN